MRGAFPFMSSTALRPAQDLAPPRLSLLSACLLMLVALVDAQVVAAIAPQIASGLDAAKATVAGSVTAYSLAAAGVALLLGRYGRRLRPVVWLPRAALVFVAANVLAASAPHALVFWAARAAAGFAGGLVSALVIAALADASSYARRGRQMSGVAVCYFLAPVAGVPLGAWAAAAAGWRAVFGGAAVLVALAGLLVRQFPLTVGVTGDQGDHIDGPAAGRGNKPRPDDGRTHKTSLWELATRTRSTRRGVVSAFFVSGGLVGLTTYLGAWLADAFYAGAREVGLTYALAGVGAVAGGAAGGVLADRYGKRRVAAASSALMIVCVLLLPGFAWGGRLWALVGLTAFLAALRVAPLQALITELVAPADRPAYVALRNGASQLGIASAVAAGRWLYPAAGLTGVAALSALLTLGAYLSLRKLDEPGAAYEGPPPEGETQLTTGLDGKHAPLPAARGRGARGARKLAAALLVLLLLVVFGLPWLLSFAVTKAGTRPDEKRRTDTPAAHGAPYEDVTFTSADGNRLSGWFLPAQGDARATRRPVTFVMTHGLFRSRYELFDRGLALQRAGYNVLLYDLRRHGQSRAEFSTIGYYERRDVGAALAFVRGRVPGGRVVLFGVSMGAAATLLAAAEETASEDVIAIIAESSFLSFADTIRHHVSLTPLPAFPFADLLIKFTGWRMNFAPEEFDVLRAVGRVRQPILFIGGGADERMPNATVLEPLYAAAPHPLKSKYVVEGARHGRAFDAAPAEYLEAVGEFLQKAEAGAR